MLRTCMETTLAAATDSGASRGMDGGGTYGGAMAAGCAFCSIIAGQTAADVVLDRPDFLAFLDARPVFKGHTLLVPREHVVTLLDLPADLRDGFLATAQVLAGAVVSGLGAHGSFVAMNNVVSQSVPH